MEEPMDIEGGTVNTSHGGAVGEGGSVNTGDGGSVNTGGECNVNTGKSGSVNTDVVGSLNDGEGGSMNTRRGCLVNTGKGASLNTDEGGSLNGSGGGTVNIGHGDSENTSQDSHVNIGEGCSTKIGESDSVSNGQGGNVYTGEEGHLASKSKQKLRSTEGPKAEPMEPMDIEGGTVNTSHVGAVSKCCSVNTGKSGSVNTDIGGSLNSGEGGSMNTREGSLVNTGKGGSLNSDKGGSLNGRGGGSMNTRGGCKVNTGKGGSLNSDKGGSLRGGGNVNIGHGDYMNTSQDSYVNHGQGGYVHTGEEGHQALKLKQKHRSTEASQQMLYDVFGFVIAMLEEFERRELRRRKKDPDMMQKSNIRIPEQRHKSFEDVKGILEAQLLMFESQLSACPKKAKNKIKDQLKWRTLDWAAVRAEKMPKELAETDRYLSQLYEILSTGRTQHPDGEEVTVEDMASFIPSIIAGCHKQEVFDKTYKENRDKQAVPTAVRSSNIEKMFENGAIRVAHYLPEELREAIVMDVKAFQNALKKEKANRKATEISSEADKAGGSVQ